MKVRFAVTPPAAALHEDVFGDYLARCEALGFDTVWLSDIPLGPLGDPLLSLAWAAGRTRRLKLGANIVPLGRNPLWLARQLAQLDRLSHGRLLLAFVPGLGQPAERAALGHARGERGRAMEQTMDLLRRWWAGEALTAQYGEFNFDGIALAPPPLQQPLELWLGGKSRAALDRVARCGDGWLTSAMTPAEARDGRSRIAARALALERHIDDEHYGISIPVARAGLPQAALEALRERRADRDLTDIVAAGRSQLRALIASHIDGGLSKFVLRPLHALDSAADWRADLAWLADSVLDLQS